MGQCVIMTGGYAGDSSDDCTATKSQVLEGYKAITKDSDDDAELGTMSNKGAWTNRIGINGKVIIPAGYHNGSGYVDQAIANRGAWGTSIGINGNITIPEGYHNGQGHVTQSIATMGGQTITPSASQQTVACNGKYMTGNVTVNGVSNLSAANIKRGATVGGVAGTCDWAVSFSSNNYVNLPLNDYISTTGRFERTVTVPSMTASHPYVVLWLNVSFTYGSSNGETYSFCCPGNYRNFEGGLGSPCYDKNLKIGFMTTLYRTDSQVKIVISNLSHGITLTRILLEMYAATNVDING